MGVFNMQRGTAAGGVVAVMLAVAGQAVGQQMPDTARVGVSPTAGQQGMAAVANPAEQEAARDPLASTSDKTKVKVDEHLIVDLHVNDEDLINVLQMLSIQSQKSILTSRNVSATVTANLYGVTFYEALDAILHVNGYGYIERGNFIFVYTLEELQKIADQQRQRVWKTIKLNYLNATDAAEFVKPLLSEGGQIKSNGKTPTFTISENAPTGADEFAHGATMLVFDFEENVAEIEKLVAELDTKPAQVLVEATILQTTLNEANAFGVDFSIIGDLNFTDFLNIGGPLRAVDGLISGSGGEAGSGGGGGGGAAALPADGKGRAVTSTPGNTSGPGTLKLGIVQNDVAAFVRLLDEVADTQIVSRPNILTLNRQPARVLVGQKVGYLNTTSTDTATTQTVEFLDTGTQLYFRPFVSSDGTIRMELKPKVSEAVIREATDSTGRAVTIPDELTNEITTNVTVRDGQTVVLGGLFRESVRSSRRQVPFVGDIPVIGAAFRGHDDSTQRSEIIFMITPSIVNDQQLLDQGRRAEGNIERVRAGSRTGLLPWSRDKRSAQLLVEATELARGGERDRALHKVQRALALNPNQPDAIQLREALLNNRQLWPTRSQQHEIISGELEKKIHGMPAGSPAPSSRREPAPARPTAQPAAEPAVQASAGDPGVNEARPAWTDAAEQPENAPAFTDEMNAQTGEMDATTEVDPSGEMDPMGMDDSNAEQYLTEDGVVEVVVTEPAPTTPAATGATPTTATPVAGSLRVNGTPSALSSPTGTSMSASTPGQPAMAQPRPAASGMPSLSAMWKAWEAGRRQPGSQPAGSPAPASTTATAPADETTPR